MRFLIIFYILFLTCFSEARLSQRIEQFEYFVNEVEIGSEVELFTEIASNQRDNALVTRFQGRLDHQINSYAYANAEARFSFAIRGTTQAINFLIPERQQGGFEPLSIYLGLVPEKDLEFLPQYFQGLKPQLKAGVINQNFLEAPLLISDWGFIGLKQEFSFDSLTSRSVDEFNLVFQQTMPSSVVANLNYKEQIQNQAFFFTGSVFMKHNYRDLILTRGNFTAFNFVNLSSEAAEKGRSLGNMVITRFQGADSRFPYSTRNPFYGGHLGLSSYIYLYEELDLEFGFNFLWNIAEFRKLYNYDRYLETIFSGESKSYSVLLRLYIPLISLLQDVILVPSYEYFVSAPQASPAYYNSYQYGYSDRMGHILGAKFLFNRKYFLNIEYRVFQKITLNQTDAIGDLNYISFTFGRDYNEQI